MLVLEAYDGLGSVTAVPLRSLELWITVKGLPPSLRSSVSLSIVGSAMGRVIRFDQFALTRKETEQRIRLVLDTRRRVRISKQFAFSVAVEVDLEFTFALLKDFCRDCGLLEYDLGDCDKGLLNESVKAKEAPHTQTLAGLSLCAPTIFSGQTSSADVLSSSIAKSSHVYGFFGSDQIRLGLLASGLLRDFGKPDLGIHRPKEVFFSVLGFSAYALAVIPKC